MEIIYRSYDGKDFYTEADCLKHENESPAFRMYDDSGVTTDVDCAKVVILLNENGAKAFVEACERSDSPHEGIDEDTYFSSWDPQPLVFYWDEGLEEYREIEKDIWGVLSEVFVKYR